MQVRRWWQTAAAATLIGALGISSSAYGQAGAATKAAPAAAPAPTAVAPAATATSMPASPTPPANVAAIPAYVEAQALRMSLAANATDARSVREEIYALLVPSTGPAPAAAYVTKLAETVAEKRRGGKDFATLMLDPREFVAMNAAILLAQMGDYTINTDAALLPGLTSKSAAVRYWTAKGFAKITPPSKLGLVPAAISRVLQSLEKAILAEKSPVVRVELINAVKAAASAEAVDVLTHALDAQATAFLAGPPTAADIASANAAASAAADLIKTPVTLKGPQEAALVTATSNVGSFAAQQLFNQSVAGTVPPGVQDETANFQATAAGVLGALKPATRFPSPKTGASPVEIMRVADSVFGSDAGKGMVQAAWTTVPAPARVK